MENRLRETLKYIFKNFRFIEEIIEGSKKRKEKKERVHKGRNKR